MTTPLAKPIRRTVRLAGVVYVVELAPGGLSFRRARRRARVVVPLALVLELAERCAGDEAYANRQLERLARRAAR